LASHFAGADIQCQLQPPGANALPPNNSLMLTRLAGENAVVLGQPSPHTMEGQA